VIGGGNRKDGNALREVASSLHIEDQVSMIGRVSDEDLPALYAEAQAYVYPSECEGFGLQVCEALAAGSPVLVADATSLPEVLADGGDIFTLSNPNQLAEMLIRLHNDIDYKADISSAEAIFVLNSFPGDAPPSRRWLSTRSYVRVGHRHRRVWHG
jgi:glycosyltransferase involved in cell wall biosynthesis